MNILTRFSVGQYVDGNRSWLRIIDSRLKIIVVMIFLITPIWAGPIWRLSLVGCLLLITFLSLLPSRVWWRSLCLLSCLSLLIGFISILASFDIQSLDSSLRNPNELEVVLESYKNWDILQIPSQKVMFIDFGPYNFSRKALELGIKTSTLIFTVIHSVNLMLITTPPEDLVWAIKWFLAPLTLLGFPMDKLSFQLLLALRFLPLVQEELQNLFRSIGVRAIEFRKLGLKSTLGLFVTLGERLLSNILLRAEQGADSLMSREGLWLSSQQLRPSIVVDPRYLWMNLGSIFLLLIAIILRCLYGTS